MPPLADWFNIAAMWLGAIGLDAPVKMNIAKTAGYRVAMVGGLCIGLAVGWSTIAQQTAHEVQAERTNE